MTLLQNYFLMKFARKFGALSQVDIVFELCVVVCVFYVELCCTFVLIC